MVIAPHPEIAGAKERASVFTEAGKAFERAVVGAAPCTKGRDETKDFRFDFDTADKAGEKLLGVSGMSLA
jgi:hypothetical protein